MSDKKFEFMERVIDKNSKEEGIIQKAQSYPWVCYQVKMNNGEIILDDRWTKIY